jgi:hypothetical protein
MRKKQQTQQAEPKQVQRPSPAPAINAVAPITLPLPSYRIRLPHGRCAKTEWDCFMGLVRQHEQEAHVDVSAKFVKELGE